MITIIENIVTRAFLAFFPSILWTFFSYLIIYGLYNIKNKTSVHTIKEKNFLEIYSDNICYVFGANYMIITLILIFFIREI